MTVNRSEKTIDSFVPVKVLKYTPRSRDQVEALAEIKAGDVPQLQLRPGSRDTSFGQLPSANRKHGLRRVDAVDIATGLRKRHQNSAGAASELQNGGFG